MNNTTNNWEERFDAMLCADCEKDEAHEKKHCNAETYSFIKSFIRTLLHDTEIAVRDKAWNEGHKECERIDMPQAIEQARKEGYEEGRVDAIFGKEFKESFREKWKTEAREEIKKEIDLAITQVHGGGNGRRLLEQLRDTLSH